MKYVERLLRYLFWIGISACIAWIFKKFFDGATRASRVRAREPFGNSTELPKTSALFRDPVCGTYVAENISYSLSQSGESLHFCSRDCMERYKEQRSRYAEIPAAKIVSPAK